MQVRFILSDYVDAALGEAEFDKLSDGTFAGRIPSCIGVIAFGGSLRECERELRSTLEDWILVGLKLGHQLPVVSGIDLNRETADAEVESLVARVCTQSAEFSASFCTTGDDS
jgi:predicted RNase H-like HicB family nuclease